MRRVAVLHLGRSGALGGRRRVETWSAIAVAAGAIPLPLDLGAHRARTVGLSRAAGLLTAEIVPEALSWSASRVRRQLLESGADVVICVTARSFDPAVLPAGVPIVLDFVDSLSDNYSSRLACRPGLRRRLAFAALRGPMERFERRKHPAATATAAGWHDAARLGVQWVPNVLPPVVGPPRPLRPHYDAVFHGTLAYEPNVQALEALQSVWRALRQRRPGARLLVAGAAPPPRVTRLVRTNPGWDLLADFPSLADVLASARLGLAPLLAGSGFQNKVLECAAHGLPVLTTRVVARGLDPDFPALVCDRVEDLAAATAHLLEDGATADRLARRAFEHVRAHYVPERHAHVLTELLQGLPDQPTAQQ